MITRVAILMAVVAEALAVYAFAEWVAAAYGGPHPHAVAAVAFALDAVCAFYLPQLLEGWDLSARTRYIVTGLAAYVVIFGALHVQFGGSLAIWDFSWATNFFKNATETTQAGGHAVLGAILLIAVWIRASMRAVSGIELEFIPKAIGWPFAAVTFIAIFGAATDRSGEVARAAIAAYAVIVLALAGSQLALSGATFGDIRAGGVTATLIGGTIAATLVCLLVFGTLFTLFASPISTVLGTVIGGILDVILQPWAWLLRHIFLWMLQGRDPLAGFQQQVQQVTQDAKQGQPHHGTPLAVKILVYGLRILALLIVGGLIAGATLLFVRFRHRRSELQQAGVTAGTSGSLAADIRSLLGSMFRRSQPGRYLPPTTSPAVELYRDVVRRAEARGRPRDPAETAEEYSPALAETLRTDVTDDITRAFQQARYGAREPDAAALAELRRRWDTVR